VDHRLDTRSGTAFRVTGNHGIYKALLKFLEHGKTLFAIFGKPVIWKAGICRIGLSIKKTR
jgi:hypothetical protein